MKQTISLPLEVIIPTYIKSEYLDEVCICNKYVLHGWSYNPDSNKLKINMGNYFIECISNMKQSLRFRKTLGKRYFISLYHDTILLIQG